ncbi:uncharacterized protein LOC112904668 [Agrilus planipennis]|uniref:Uncharacterized protein LOC112904668 n=1 Tax=Agrilus planipennis TaxID=224129 RepID=A0A7F5R0E3_AGRPL|nr:uncharacterized protein LOC112904668 [Agrilus planipennis]
MNENLTQRTFEWRLALSRSQMFWRFRVLVLFHSAALVFDNGVGRLGAQASVFQALPVRNRRGAVPCPLSCWSPSRYGPWLGDVDAQASVFRVVLTPEWLHGDAFATSTANNRKTGNRTLTERETEANGREHEYRARTTQGHFNCQLLIFRHDPKMSEMRPTSPFRSTAV